MKMNLHSSSIPNGLTRLASLARHPAWKQIESAPGTPLLLAALSGALGGMAFPGGSAPGLWFLVYLPFFLALDWHLRKTTQGTRRRWLGVLALSWVMGVVQGGVSGAWVVNTAHVYGHLPMSIAWLTPWVSVGSLFGVEAFFFLGVPFLLFWQTPRLGVFAVPLWSAVFQAWFPRFFFWTYGQFLHPIAPLTQLADAVGSAGLNLWVVTLHLWFYGLWRAWRYPDEIPFREILTTGVVLVAMFGTSAVYGLVRMSWITEQTRQGAPVNLAAVQPNFSLGYLASNPALSHSDRRRNLNALLDDTRQALAELPENNPAPTVTVWPESVFPLPYFRDDRVRQALEWWVRERNIHLILTSLTEELPAPGKSGRRKVYGSSLHVSPTKETPEVYNKIALIPFGETIPLANVIPGFRELLKAWIPQISEFEKGREYTVFEVNDDVRLAPMICFDVVQEHVARGMARNGANLGLVLANLAWFGKTNVSELFEFYVRFRAIENRIPVLLLSQNGESILLDAAGRPASRRLGQFQQEWLSIQVNVPDTFSLYTHFSWLIDSLMALALASVIYLYRRERLPTNRPAARPRAHSKPKKRPVSRASGKKKK